MRHGVTTDGALVEARHLLEGKRSGGAFQPLPVA